MNSGSLSCVDGRYRKITDPLRPFLSDHALVVSRAIVEIDWLRWLIDSPLITLDEKRYLNAKGEKPNFEALVASIRADPEPFVERCNEREKTTNHDIKAIEYVLGEIFDEAGFPDIVGYIHFGLTSEDIADTARTWYLRRALVDVVIPAINAMTGKFVSMAKDMSVVPMLARTHGQPAVGTTFGKELAVYASRLMGERDELTRAAANLRCKFGGAVGNHNALCAAFPNVDWAAESDMFVRENYHVERETFTTQVNSNSSIARVLHSALRVCTIIRDFCQDAWMMNMLGTLEQKVKASETGSSTMPQKVNLITVENGLGMATTAASAFGYLAEWLPVSFLQRSLDNSARFRDLGVPFGCLLVSINSVTKALDKIQPNVGRMNAELEANYASLSEAAQTILRREGFPDPYEWFKDRLRGRGAIDMTVWKEIINKLPADLVTAEVRAEILAITPHNYIGNAEKTAVSRFFG